MYRELARRYVLGKGWESGVGGQFIARVSGRERGQPPTQAKERLEWATRPACHTAATVSTTTGTPAGTYSVTVNATSGNATRSTLVTLVVQ
jgi:hypothetical protein